jgi:hypothetical protein
MNTVHKLSLAALASLCVVAAAFAVLAAPVRAAVVHAYLAKPSEEITKEVDRKISETPRGLGVTAIAADSGELYTVEIGSDGGHDGLAKFSVSPGAFLSQFPEASGLSYFEGVAVAHSTGEVYVAADEFGGNGAEGAVAVFNAAGSLQKVWKGVETKSGGFGCFDCDGPGAVAVDNSSNVETAGDVYVVSPKEHVVDVFKPGAGGTEETEPVAEITGISPTEPFNKPSAVAIDEANGDVLVVDGERVVDVFKYTTLGGYEFVRKITGTPGRGFGEEFISGVAAVGGEGDGDIYVGAGSVVDQFSSEGVYLGQLTGFNRPTSVAVDPSSGDVVVANNSTVDVFGPNIVIPDVITGPAADLTPYSATLTGTVKLDGEGEATCQFAWGTTPALEETPMPCTAPVTEEESPVHVTLSQATHTKLQPDTTYYYRLQAANRKNGILNPGGPQEPQPECEGQPAALACFKTPGPVIHEESVVEVTNSTATLQARIDPDGAATSYYFQYATKDTEDCTPSTCTALPGEPGVGIGSGTSDAGVEQQLPGLPGGALYHYRVVAVSEVPIEVAPGKLEVQAVSFYGPDETFTTQGAGAFGLPDGRQWELVSPPVMRGARISPLNSGFSTVEQAASGGGAITYAANLPTETDVRGYVAGVQMLSTRGAGGWSSRDLTIPHSSTVPVGLDFEGFQDYPFFSEDLSLAVAQQIGLAFTALSPEASEQTPYLYETGSGAYTPLFIGCPAVGEPCAPSVEEHADVPRGTVFGNSCGKNVNTGKPTGYATVCGPRIIAVSPDAKHVVLGGGGESDMSEWSGGSLTPIGEGYLGSVEGGGGITNIRHAISDDGSRVFFSTAIPGGQNGEHHLYMRDVSNSVTVQLDVPEAGCVKAGTCGRGGAQPEFQLASSGGSRVFFTDLQTLTEGARGSNGEPDLYECEIVQDACRLSDLTPSAGIQGLVIGASDDGSWVYFVSGGVLGDGAQHGAVAGGHNLYVAHDGVARLIAVLSSEDSSDWAGGSGATALRKLTARVSPDGEWLTFMSQRSLTGYDNRDASSDALDEEVYLYGAEGERLTCASCNPTGARPHGEQYGKGEFYLSSIPLVGGEGEWENKTWLAANVPAWSARPDSLENFYQPRYLLDGGRLFFNSSDALVPKDVNGQEDVYEYEPEGAPAVEHACSSASGSGSVVYRPVRVFAVEGHRGEEGAGCVGLISSGTSAEESGFIDASESGADVFFITASHLVPQDVEGGVAMYDAHECAGSSPCFAETAAPPACVTVEGCRAAPEPQPAIFGEPSSATFSGAGNITPTSTATAGAGSNTKRCRKGFTRRKGACVRRKAGKRTKKKKERGRGARRSEVTTAGERGRARS